MFEVKIRVPNGVNRVLNRFHIDDGGNVRPCVYTSMTGGVRRAACTSITGRGTISSDHRYANSYEGRRFCVTQRWRGGLSPDVLRCRF